MRRKRVDRWRATQPERSHDSLDEVVEAAAERRPAWNSESRFACSFGAMGSGLEGDGESIRLWRLRAKPAAREARGISRPARRGAEDDVSGG